MEFFVRPVGSIARRALRGRFRRLQRFLEANGLVDGYSFWTFSDIFEENYFPSKPFHGGFGLLTLHGIPKPSYRAFELFHDLGDRQSLVDGLHETVDCSLIHKDSSVTSVAHESHHARSLDRNGRAAHSIGQRV